MAPTYKLTYFNGRGRGETARLVFAAADQQYEDHRIERDAWAGQKAAVDPPFGQLPVLEVTENGHTTKLCQSNSIARLLAKRFNLAGKTDLEQARADMIVDCFDDGAKPLIAIFLEKDDAKKAELKTKFTDEQLPQSLTYLENILGGNAYFVGNDLTWTDLAFLNFIGWCGAFAGIDKPLGKFPKLQALHDKVEHLPKIAAWIAKRPKTPF